MNIRIKRTNLHWVTISTLLIIAALFFFFSNRPKQTSEAANNSGSADTITFEGDTQVITLAVRGGYTPRTVQAKANTKTILRMKTKNTFDCSAEVSIPQLQYFEILPASGTKDIQISPQNPGSTIAGTCGMGMYGFNLTFL